MTRRDGGDATDGGYECDYDDFLKQTTQARAGCAAADDGDCRDNDAHVGSDDDSDYRDDHNGDDGDDDDNDDEIPSADHTRAMIYCPSGAHGPKKHGWAHYITKHVKLIKLNKA